MPGNPGSVENSAVTSGAPEIDSDQTIQPTEQKTDDRKTYTVEKQILHGGLSKSPGEEVKLTDSQAEQLKKSGHIKAD